MTDTQSNKVNETHSDTGYWIRHPLDNGFTPVTKHQYVVVERANGFHNTLGQPAEPATAAFSGPAGVRGTTVTPDNIEPIRDYPKTLNYYDRSGNPITLEQWSDEWQHNRVLCDDLIGITDEPFYLRTMYLGFVDGYIDGAKLFGTVIVDSIPSGRANVLVELETYDSATHAYVGHLGHLAALRNGFHCRLCHQENRTSHRHCPNG